MREVPGEDYRNDVSAGGERGVGLRTFVAELGGVCGRTYDGKVGAAEEGADCGLHCVAGAAMRVGVGSKWSEVASDVRCQMAGVACDG